MTTPHYIDTHCHLDLPIFDQDRDQVLQDAAQQSVSDIIIPAIAKDNWQTLKVLQTTSKQQPRLHMSYGLHPMFMQQHHQSHIDDLRDWLNHNESIAVGECGLDFFIQNPDKTAQLELFEAQVKLSCDYDLPLIIHSRKSLDFILKTLRKYPKTCGVIHCFSGSEQQAMQLIERNFYLGFGGPITYVRAKKLRRLIATLPLERLLLETDAPDQPDSQHRGQRNQPSWIPLVAKTIAELHEISVAEVAHTTSANAKTLFQLGS